MKKKTIIICIFCIFLLESGIVTSGTNIISIEKIEEQNSSNYKTQIQFTADGNLIKNEYLKNSNEDVQMPIDGGKPDLKITEYRAAWGFNEFYYNDYGVFIYISIKNIGLSYHSDNEIEVVVAFFADDETTPLDTLIVAPMFDPYNWQTFHVLTYAVFFLRSNGPATLTAKVDYTNIIDESNEDNNEETCPVQPVITIEGTVYRKVTGGQVVCKGAHVYAERGSETDERGHYSVGVIPKAPFNLPDRYLVMAFWGDYRPAKKWSSPALPGERTKLDFVLWKQKDRAIDTPFLNFLEDHPNMFSMFQKLLQRLEVY